MNRILPSLVGGSLFAAAGLSAQTSAPAEWGQFRGPNHDGTVPALQVNWKGAGVKTLWKAEVTKGFSSFAVAGGKAYTLVTGEHDGNVGEMLVCLDVKTGK